MRPRQPSVSVVLRARDSATPVSSSTVQGSTRAQRSASKIPGTTNSMNPSPTSKPVTNHTPAVRAILPFMAANDSAMVVCRPMYIAETALMVAPCEVALTSRKMMVTGSTSMLNSKPSEALIMAPITVRPDARTIPSCPPKSSSCGTAAIAKNRTKLRR